MADIESITKTTLEEIKKVINTNTVVGEPINIEDNTVIPLISIGFGFGAGNGIGRGEKQKGEIGDAVTGGGVGIKPAAVIIINKEGVRVEPIMGSMSTAIEKIGVAIPKAIEKLGERVMPK